MVNQRALGIIFPNSYDATAPELTEERSMGSVPFAGRYRLVDFILSSMVHGGIDNISVLCRENYLSLLDHLGSGREWDLTRKNGGLNIVPPFAQKNDKVYHGRIQGLMNLMAWIQRQKEEYVVMSDANIAVNFNFKDFLAKHIASGADVTIAYTKGDVGTSKRTPNANNNYYVLKLDGDVVKEIEISPMETESDCLSINIMVAKREWLMEVVRNAYVKGDVFFERDVLAKNVDTMKICGYEVTEYVANIHSLQTYFDESMKLLDEDNLDALFGGETIYTKVRDDNPTRYIGAPAVKKVLCADGCVIEGTVENCVLFRGVKIGKGAVVKNCVLMQDTIVGEGAEISYVITDKNVVVGKDKKVSGTDTFPVFVAKGKEV